MLVIEHKFDLAKDVQLNTLSADFLASTFCAVTTTFAPSLPSHLESISPVRARLSPPAPQGRAQADFGLNAWGGGGTHGKERNINHGAHGEHRALLFFSVYSVNSVVFQF